MLLPAAVLAKESTDSTMEDARSALRTGYGHGTVCTARTQSAGRGRVAGRRWDDGEGDLLFTLILERARYLAAYPPTQALALALCRRLEAGYGLSPTIKWPNDVLVSGAKIAGILVETEGGYFLAGMGVNLVRREYPEGLRRPAVSIAAAAERHGGGLSGAVPPAPEAELSALLEEIDAVIRTAPPISEIAGRLDGLGRTVDVRLGDPARSEMLRGVISGLGADGSLQVTTVDGRIVPVYSGEIEA